MRVTERSGSLQWARTGAWSICASLTLAAALGSRAYPRAATAHAADARSAAPQLTLEVPRELRVGEHAHVELTLELPPEAAESLLLTAYREGKSLEVVKGRLLRSDARDPAARPLRFALPVLATAPGTALVGVRLLAYVCAPACRAVEAETRYAMSVLALTRRLRWKFGDLFCSGQHTEPA